MLLLILIFQTGKSCAQELDELMELSIEELMDFPISTASKFEQKISESPATVYVFTRQDIKENGYRYLSDVLRYIPNMDVHWSGGPQYALTSKLRGLAEFIVLMDGFRINPASSVSPHFGYVYPLNHVKRVEVIMGPSSALYGADACAGIISIITFEPGIGSVGYNISAFGGNHNHGGAQVLLQQSFKDLTVQLSLSGFHLNDNNKSWWSYLEKAYSRYPSGISENYEPDYNNPLTSFTASGKVKSGNNALGFNFWTRNIAGGLRLNPAKYAANKHAKTSSYQYLLYLQNIISFNERLTLQSRLSHDYYMVRYNFFYTQLFLDDPKHYRESADRFHWLEEFQLHLPYDTRLLFGLEMQSIVSVPKDYKSITDSSGNETGFGKPISSDEALTYYQIRSGGMFLQAENTLFRNRLKTNLGIRTDYFSTFGTVVNPRASIYYRLAAPFSARVMYGRAFFTPPPYKMYRITYVPGQRYQTTNKNLDPRTNTNYEAAIDYHPFSRLSMEVRAFRNEVEDEIVFVNTNLPHIINSDTVNIYQHQNIGNARYEGIEGFVRLLLPLKIKAQSSASFMRGHTRKNTESKKKDLELFSQVKVAWNINKKILKIVNFNVQGLHLLKRSVKTGNALYPHGKMPGVFLLNAYVSAANLWRGLGGHLKIENVLNKEWSDIPGPSSSASPELPQEQVRISLGLDWQL